MFVLCSGSMGTTGYLALVNVDLASGRTERRLNCSSFLLGYSFVCVRNNVPCGSLGIIRGLLKSIGPIGVTVSSVMYYFSSGGQTTSFGHVLHVGSQII